MTYVSIWPVFIIQVDAPSRVRGERKSFHNQEDSTFSLFPQPHKYAILYYQMPYVSTLVPNSRLPLRTGEPFPCETADDVRIFISPWVTGVKMLESFGTHEFTITFANGMEDIFLLPEKKIREKAFKLGANAIYSFELEIHLWEDPIVCNGKGTFATIGPL